MDAYLDYVSLTAGPPFGRIDLGCDPQSYTGPPLALCPELSNAPFTDGSAVNTKLDTWEHTTTCGAPSPSSEDQQRWAADSMVSATANYNYPQTGVAFRDCAINPNGTTGGAYFFSQAISSARTVECFTGCSGEDLGSAGWTAQGNDLIANCQPRH
jgi:hypothetical protein